METKEIIDIQRKVIDSLESNFSNQNANILELERVEDFLKDLKNNKEYFMLLVKDSTKPPKFVHESRELATIEANRLAKWLCKDVCILKIENIIEYKEVIEIRLEKTSPKDYFEDLPF